MNLPQVVYLTFPSLPGENVLHVRDADTQSKIYRALELQFGKRYPWYDQCIACLSHWVFVFQFFCWWSSFPFFFLVLKEFVLYSKLTFFLCTLLDVSFNNECKLVVGMLKCASKHNVVTVSALLFRPVIYWQDCSVNWIRHRFRLLPWLSDKVFIVPGLM